MSGQLTYKTCLCEGCKNFRKEKGLSEPDPNTAYNTEAHRIAEIFAKIAYPIRYKWLQLKYPLHEQWEEVISEVLPEARAMMAEMAKRIRITLENEGRNYDISIEDYLIKCGLTPAVVQEAAQNE